MKTLGRRTGGGQERGEAAKKRRRTVNPSERFGMMSP